MALIPPFFLDCVVAIGRRNDSGDSYWSASGFLYGYFVGPGPTPGTSNYRTYLVSNRHVFEGEKSILVRQNKLADEPAQEIFVDLALPGGEWVGHPEEAIDVAVMPVSTKYLRDNGLTESYFHGNSHALTVAQMNDLGVSEGDAAYVLGFPMGLAGEKRNYVVARGATVARVRDCLLGAARTFLVDTLIFPGNSGGPAIVPPELTAIQDTKSHDKAYLVGVVSAYIPYRDRAVSAQTGQTRVIFEENSGLAIVYPVDCINQTIQRHLAGIGFDPTQQVSAPSEVPPDGTAPADAARLFKGEPKEPSL